MVEVSADMKEDSTYGKLQEAVMERDQMWRAHEKAQIAFLQNQTAQMTRNLHLELERLMNVNRDLSRKLNRKATALEKTLERTIAFYKDELNHHEDRIRQLTAELHDRTQTVTQLSTQLRSIKLREAMAQAQQRRRASCTSPKSPVSPTESNSAFRLFGFYSSKPPKRYYLLKIFCDRTFAAQPFDRRASDNLFGQIRRLKTTLRNDHCQQVTFAHEV
ncbi:hypothetical protein FO519_001674 [Halicephalobus sp. NKZ332]|nr:hypothetical protein FO519_001674 [Halicephalobus sp. NKZ332]